ncbi:MAG TPA: phosphate/phosphite/phosphonate ABC transporter substrate-binding protein [Desulfosalsimonadaceae bacterium]|nr:phosphate/phosphite/phosphonate ABC transporter substrate-binding protein [Desulfosalsimonadaceae bacterium]
MSRRKQIQARKELESLTYACLPQYSHRVSFSRHHRLVEYIAEQTGLPIRQIFPDTFEAHVQMVGAGKIDISFSNPLVYTRIADRYQARAFARIVEKNGKPAFRGQIICRADNKAIQNLQDCRNKRWMAVAPTSAAGYLFVLDHFLRHGISKEDFRSISFAPGPGAKQEKVVQAVYLGEADIGSIREGTLDLVEDRVDLSAIRILDRTRRFPSWVYAAGKGLSPDVVEKIRTALLDLDPAKPEHRQILELAHFRSIIDATDQDFDPIRELTSQVRVQSGE